MGSERGPAREEVHEEVAKSNTKVAAAPPCREGVASGRPLPLVLRLLFASTLKTAAENSARPDLPRSHPLLVLPSPRRLAFCVSRGVSFLVVDLPSNF